MTTKFVAAIQRALAGMRKRRGRRAWRASLAETRRGQWHQTPRP